MSNEHSEEPHMGWMGLYDETPYEKEQAIFNMMITLGELSKWGEVGFRVMKKYVEEFDREWINIWWEPLTAPLDEDAILLYSVIGCGEE